jgi:probable F420-dependent oxidoreductase
VPERDGGGDDDAKIEFVTANGPVSEPRFGVLLPHFGASATRELITSSARTLEDLGFDSVWVRDHVIYRPHEHEEQNLRYLDGILTLAFVAAETSRIALGTAVLIPHRHPIYLAQLMANLDFLAGPGRVILGMGTGRYDDEFEAIGMGGIKRGALLEEQVEILRKLWTGEAASHDGAQYHFDSVTADPHPLNGHIPVWCGGKVTATLRRVARQFDGWLASRIPRRDFAPRVRQLEELAHEAGRQRPTVAVVVQVSPAATVEEGAAAMNLAQLGAELDSSKFLRPPSGRFAAWEDFDGVVLPGPADVIAGELGKYQELGAEHFVLDLRNRVADWDDCLAMLGEEVLPLMRR